MTQLIGEVKEGWDLTLAYRWYDVQTNFLGTGDFKLNPLSAVNRAFANTEVKLNKKWRLDYTLSWTGKARIPGLNNHPADLKRPTESDDYWISNTQISFTPSDKWDFYVGAENLFNYQQSNPIVDANDPFSEFFDASLIWAPVFGRKIYGGLRVNF